MKNRIKYMSKTALSTVLAICMLISCLSVGLISTDAAYSDNKPVAEIPAEDNIITDTDSSDNVTVADNAKDEEPLGVAADDEAVGGGRNWHGKIYFRAPDSWNLSTNPYVQAWAVQSTSASSGTKYAFLLANMSVVGSTNYSRLYSATLSTDHSSWDNSEYLVFTANTSNWGTGDFYVSTCALYTKPYNYGVENDSGAYFFKSDTAAGANNATMIGSYNSTEATVINAGTQKAYAYTNSSSSNTGGTVSLSAYYLNGTTPTNSTISNTITATYDNSVQGTKVTMTASVKSGYYFDGWYTSSAFSTKVSSSTEYTYYAYEGKSYYARFLPAYTVTVAAETGGSVASTTLSALPNTATTLPTATPDFGYKFNGWTTSSSMLTLGNASSASAATVTATSSGGTVTANFVPDNNMNIYIVGRFKYRATASSGWTYTSTTDSTYWDDDSTNIKMTATSTDFVYKLETNASLAELSASIQSNPPYFHIRSGSNIYYPASNTVMTTSPGTTLGTTGSNNMYFSSDLAHTPVTIYFNTSTKKIWYETPTYYNITCNTATGGSVSSNVSTQKQGETVTLTLSPSTGYTSNGVTVKDASNNNVTVSGSGNSYTFTMPASNVTVTPSFTETTHTVTVVRRLYTTGATSPTSTSTIQTITGVGVATTGTVNTVDAAYGDYSFENFTLSDSTNLIVASGSLSNRNSFTINAKADNLVVYANYRETLYSITVQTNDSTKGVVKRGSTTVSGSTTQIGNVTAVTLAATNNSGYAFDYWTVTKGSSGTATTALVGGTTITLTSSEQNVSGASASTTFKFNGTATVKAYFKNVDYSLNAQFTYNSDTSWNNNSVATTDTSGTAKSSLVLNELFEVRVTLADGYAVDSVTFTTGTGYGTATIQSGYPTTSGNVAIYRYKFTGAGNITAKVTLKAVTPTISSVKIRDKNKLVANVSYWQEYADGADVNLFFKQPVNAVATTDSFSKLAFYVYKADGTTVNDSETNKSSGTEVSLDPDISIIPLTEDGEVSYSFKITATNAPAGVTAASVTYTYTMKVTFNENQKIYYKLKTLLSRCIRESESNNDYYKTGARLGDYNSAYDIAKTYIYPSYSYDQSTDTETYNPTNANYPDYDADLTESNRTHAQTKLDSFKSEYRALRQNAKTTTVYILTKIPNSANNPMYMHVWGNGNSDDWKHFVMFNCADSMDGYTYVSEDTIKMSYDGVFTYSNSNKYLYKITYTGKIKFIVWRGTSSTDTNMDDADKLTSDVTNATAFKEYYINAYNTDPSSSASINSVVDYVEFGHTKNSTKTMLEIGESKTGAEIKTLLEITPISSLITAPGITVTNQSYTIEGPVGKSSSKIYDMKNNRVSSNGGTTWTTLENGKFPAPAQGKYTVNYVTRFGTNALGGDILRTCTATLWVAFDEVSIYVDMNDNVGNPVLNFKYLADSSGKPSDSGTVVTQLPYEMDLVTGSESIYKYTISISKLKDDYKITFDNDHPIKISYLAIENYFVNTNGKTTTRPTGTAIDNYAFEIGVDARVSGEVWLKADSTNLNKFNIISYGSVNKTFLAVLQDGNNTVLSSPMNRVHGIGINSDDEDMKYNSQYAALYTMDDASAPMYKFGYVLSTSAKSEIAGSGDTKYYFDKWVAMSTPADGVVITDGCLTTSYSSATDYSTDSNLNFTSAVDYLDGDGNSNDTTYIALYKTAASNDSTVRIEVTYKFNDFDTSDGNYIYEEGKTVPATYTKTIKVPVGSGQTYEDFAAVNDVNVINTIVSGVNLPHVVSNYFDYAYKTNSAEIKSATSGQSKIVVTAELTETAREYSIVLKNGSGSTTYNGYYQQTVELPSTGRTNPVWQIQSGTDNWVTLGSGETGSTFTARFVSNAESENSTDCQIIKVVNGSATAASHKSVVSNSFTEIYYDNVGTEMLGHNFYIIDYCDEGELLGGGVLYATTDSSGNYRQNSATTNLATATTRQAFITGILGTDYSTEYKAQTINNIGFRYKPYKETEDVFRYSDELHAYLTVFEGTNVNSPNYNRQKLRLFSFMVYKNGNNIEIKPSDGYAEVDRYKAG